jgi:hypothetical protein
MTFSRLDYFYELFYLYYILLYIHFLGYVYISFIFIANYLHLFYFKALKNQA